MNEKEITIKARNVFSILLGDNTEILENLPILKYTNPKDLMNKLKGINTYLANKSEFYLFLLIRELQYLSTSFIAYYRIRTKYKSIKDMTEKKKNELFQEFLEIEHIDWKIPHIDKPSDEKTY